MADPETCETNVPRERWRKAAAKIAHTISFKEDVVDFESIAPVRRIGALVQLEQDIQQDPSKRGLLEALRKKRDNTYVSTLDRVTNELFITGSRVFMLFGPNLDHTYWPVCTAVVVSVNVAVFCFMAGGFATQDLPVPGTFFKWVFGRTPFSTPYLVTWGGRWTVGVRNQPWRLLSYALVHQTGVHLLGNMIIFTLIGLHIEPRYGLLVLATIILISAVGGALLSTCGEPACTVIVGFSACVFGVLGLFAGDLVLHWNTLRRPMLRTVSLIAGIIVLIAGDISAPNGTSHLSHVGGLLTGFVPSLVLLPRLGHEIVEGWIAWLGIAFTFVYFLSTALGAFLRPIAGTVCDL